MLCSTLIQHAHTLFVDHRKELIHFGWWARGGEAVEGGGCKEAWWWTTQWSGEHRLGSHECTGWMGMWVRFSVHMAPSH